MAMELADYNIRVNAVSPAVVKTPILKPLLIEMNWTPRWLHSTAFIDRPDRES
jgi:NAD(P)-dependent dehydrogenase (short-subunit alcohol dehydrogenase family)